MKYIVGVSRAAYGYRDIEVEAESEDEAVALALAEAGNHLFTERAAEYEADFVTAVP